MPVREFLKLQGRFSYLKVQEVEGIQKFMGGRWGRSQRRPGAKKLPFPARPDKKAWAGGCPFGSVELNLVIKIGSAFGSSLRLDFEMFG